MSRSYATVVTLKIGTRSPKSYEVWTFPTLTLIPNMIKICYFVLQISLQKRSKTNLSVVTLKIEPRSPKSTRVWTFLIETLVSNMKEIHQIVLKLLCTQEFASSRTNLAVVTLKMRSRSPKLTEVWALPI